MEERKTVKKIFHDWELEKEEEWLNGMAMSGWVLDSVGFCKYNFVRCEPEEYTVKFQFIEDYNDEYKNLIKENNIEYIGKNLCGFRYFRKKTEFGELNLFSDIDSRITHLKKYGTMVMSIGIANISIGITNDNSFFISTFNFLFGALMMYTLGRIHEKKEALERERLLHE